MSRTCYASGVTFRGFPGHGTPVDDRIVAPESRAEIVDGKLYLSPPADEKRAVPHADPSTRRSATRRPAADGWNSSRSRW